MKNLSNNLLLLTSLLSFILILNIFSLFQNKDSITFLDIGQGNATLICNIYKVCGLIDTGKQKNIIDKIQQHTPNPLEFIIITHPDLDHDGQIINILNNIGSKKVFINKTSKSEEIIKSILDINLTTIFEINSNNEFKFGDYEFNLYWPTKLTDLEELASNDGSVTMTIKNQGTTTYVAGDLGSQIEEKLNITSNIILVSHHGSKNSSSLDFLDKSQANIGIISVGKNSYGHPSSQVLEHLDILKIPYFRTDLDGDIKILIDKGEYSIYTEKSKKSYIILN